MAAVTVFKASLSLTEKTTLYNIHGFGTFGSFQWTYRTLCSPGKMFYVHRVSCSQVNHLINWLSARRYFSSLFDTWPSSSQKGPSQKIHPKVRPCLEKLQKTPRTTPQTPQQSRDSAMRKRLNKYGVFGSARTGLLVW